MFRDCAAIEDMRPVISTFQRSTVALIRHFSDLILAIQVSCFRFGKTLHYPTLLYFSIQGLLANIYFLLISFLQFTEYFYSLRSKPNWIGPTARSGLIDILYETQLYLFDSKLITDVF